MKGFWVWYSQKIFPIPIFFFFFISVGRIEWHNRLIYIYTPSQGTGLVVVCAAEKLYGLKELFRNVWASHYTATYAVHYSTISDKNEFPEINKIISRQTFASLSSDGCFGGFII